MKKKLSVVSLFTGAGGLDVGLEKTGAFELLACLEYEPAFCGTLRKNRDAGRVGSPSTIIYEDDIRHVSPEQLMSDLGIEPGELDVLTGGPPCQAFSTAGRRQSVGDPRGELLWDFLRFVVALRPRYFLMENVRGLLSSALRHRPIKDRPEKGGLPLEADEEPGSVVDLWVRDLLDSTNRRYRLDIFEVNAVNYGAPQLRERALFLGNREGQILDFPQPTHGVTESQPQLFGAGNGSLTPFRTLGDAIRDLDDPDPVLMDFSPRKKRYLAMVPAGGNWRSLPEEIQQESMGKAWHAKGGRSGYWRRLSYDLPCPTITTMPNHAATSMCHPEHVRVLSVRECAAVQEFPCDWEWVGTPAEQYAQIGNAVPIKLGEVAGHVLGSAARETPQIDAPAPEAILQPIRKVNIQSHIRTRYWYKNGQAVTWEDGAHNGHATYGTSR